MLVYTYNDLFQAWVAIGVLSVFLLFLVGYVVVFVYKHLKELDSIVYVILAIIFCVILWFS